MANWIFKIRFIVAALTGLGLVWLLVGVLPMHSLADMGSVDHVDGVVPGQPPAAPLAAGVGVVKSARTAQSSTGATVADGEWITYTIRVQNTNPNTITEVIVSDILPLRTLEEGNIQCLGVYTCGLQQEKQEIKDRDGNVITTIYDTRRITWAVGSLAPGAVITREFRGRVVCHPDGYTFQNGALISYRLGEAPDSETSNPVKTVVRVAPPSAMGGVALSNGPTWCSTETGGTWDMDWGDYDADGDLDLVLASGVFGAVVYRNTDGQLTRVGPVHNGELRSARWADFDNDGLLDILVTGEWLDEPSAYPPNSTYYPGSYPYIGYNYIYKNMGNDQFTLHDNGSGYTFQSSDGILRTAMADFDGDGDVDIAVANQYASCTVQLYKNINPENLGKPPPDNDVFQTSLNWSTSNVVCLVADKPANSVAWADYNNDGLLDLAAGWQEYDPFESVVGIFRQSLLNEFSASPTYRMSVSGTSFRDLAWGDYDSDGLLDLAMAYQGYSHLGSASQVAVFQNKGGEFGSTSDITVPAVRPYSVSWVDFNSDGRLELAVGDSPPRVFDPLHPTTALITVPTAGAGPFYSIRAADPDNDGDLEIGLSDLSGRSLLFTNFGAFLDEDLTGIDDTTRGNSLAWGDMDGNGLDFVIGSADSLINQLYYNHVPAGFSSPTTGDPFYDAFVVAGSSLAIGDINNDNLLDIIFGRSSRNHIYLNGSGVFPFPDWTSDLSQNTTSVVLADFDQDDSGWLDMLVGNNGAANTLFVNTGTGFNTSPTWGIDLADATREIAWGYYDADVLPDFAVANYGQPTRIYRNNGLGGFDLAQELSASNARSVDWGDFDGDGDMDLAVGNYRQKNTVFENLGASLAPDPIWSSPDSKNTTSVVWGDWNNDGLPELAVGNYAQSDQVFANAGSVPGAPKLFLQWESRVAYDTQDLAWGDVDQDGDLDLGMASNDAYDPWNGYYRNGYLSAAHLDNEYMPHFLNSTYVNVSAPAPPVGHIWYRTALTNPGSLVIPMEFTVYDPDGPNQNGGTRDRVNLVSGQYAITSELEYSFSTDGGGSWFPATTSTLTYDANEKAYTVQWLAGGDLGASGRAVSDKVQFRVSTAHINKHGPVERARTAGISPQFRVRNLSCVWPEDAFITYSSPITAGMERQFTAFLGKASGDIVFSWDFGDANPPGATGQLLAHTYTMSGTYVITMTATGDACAMTRPAFATRTVTVFSAEFHSSTFSNTLYLPVVQGNGIFSASSGPTGAMLLNLDLSAASPSQVEGLYGESTSEGIALSWMKLGAAVEGYRVYRACGVGAGYSLLAAVPAQSASFVDSGTTCGCAYFVTAFNDGGESLASASSYFAPPCSW